MLQRGTQGISRMFPTKHKAALGLTTTAPMVGRVGFLRHEATALPRSDHRPLPALPSTSLVPSPYIRASRKAFAAQSIPQQFIPSGSREIGFRQHTGSLVMQILYSISNWKQPWHAQDQNTNVLLPKVLSPQHTKTRWKLYQVKTRKGKERKESQSRRWAYNERSRENCGPEMAQLNALPWFKIVLGRPWGFSWYAFWASKGRSSGGWGQALIQHQKGRIE